MCGTPPSPLVDSPTRKIQLYRVRMQSPAAAHKQRESESGVHGCAKQLLQRDLSLLVLRCHVQAVGRPLSVLDAMAGTGMRALRYLLEGGHQQLRLQPQVRDEPELELWLSSRDGSRAEALARSPDRARAVARR